MIDIASIKTNAVYKNTNYYREYFGESEKFADGVPNGIELACFGSSFSRFDFDFTVSERKSFNFAMWPQTLHYDNIILKHYIKHFSAKSYAFIGIVPLSFCLTNYDDDKMNWKYYRFLYGKEIERFKLRTRVFEYHYPLFFHPEYKERITNDLPDRMSIKIENADNNLFDREGLINDANHWMELWIQQCGFKNLIYGGCPNRIIDAHNRNKEVIDDFLKNCDRNSIIPVFVIMPMTVYAKRLFGGDFLDSNMYRILACFSNRKQIDFFHLSDFEDDNLYANSLFLNRKGRKIFTSEVLRLIDDR